MAASRGTTGNYGVFYIGTVASPISYNALLEVRSIKDNGVSIQEVSTTHLLSPLSTEEFIPGLIKPGTVDVMGNLVGDITQLSPQALAQGQVLVAWKWTASVDKGTKVYTRSGMGYVAKWDVGPVEQNKTIEFTLGIQITGVISESVA